MKHRFALTCLLLASAALYFYGLSADNAYLSIEEVQHARQAYALATTGRDVIGQRLPMYFAQPDFMAGRDPVWIYALAGLLTSLPFSEGLARTPSVLAGLTNVVLFFSIGRRLWRSTSMGLAGAVLVALTPAHFIQSRIATSQIVPVTCTLLWLHFLLRYLERRKSFDLSLAVASLGLALYAYLPAIFTMPLLLGVTLAVLHRTPPVEHGRPARLEPAVPPVVMACAVFALAALPLLLWHGLHPERFQLLRDYYSDNGYNRATVDVLSWPGVLNRADLWWNAFNPGALFFSGDANLRFSTRQVGHFLLPVALLAAIAASRGLVDLPTPARALVAVGLIAGPLPAVLAGDYEIKRWLVAVPFILLAALAGIARLRELPRAGAMVAMLAIGAASAVQFAMFLRDYHGDYRVRAAPWFGGNMKAAVAAVLPAARDPRCVLIDRRVYYDYWPLYATVMGRADLAGSNIVDVVDPEFAAPAGCPSVQLIVSRELVTENQSAARALAGPQWSGKPIAERAAEPILLVYHYSPIPTAPELPPAPK